MRWTNRITKGIAGLVLAAGTFVPSALAQGPNTHREIREGRSEIARERQEARREIGNARNPYERRREINEARHEIGRERLEARREIGKARRDDRNNGWRNNSRYGYRNDRYYNRYNNGYGRYNNGYYGGNHRGWWR